MADSFKLLGSYDCSPSSSAMSFAPVIGAQISEAKSLKAKQIYEANLLADTPQAISFGGVANAHVVILKVSVGGPKVKVRLTSADGNQQIVPIDSFLMIISSSVPFTAIDLTRQTGQDTTVRIFLGEIA